MTGVGIHNRVAAFDCAAGGWTIEGIAVGDKSSIEWTDSTWNPVTGCTKVSPGCANCYAEAVALRFWSTQYPQVPVMGEDEGGLSHTTRPRQFEDVMCHEDRLVQPLRWKRPRRIFVNSMSDLFHEDVPDEFIHRVYHVMEQARQHIFQVLTKRAERMRRYLEWRYGPDAEHPRGRLPSRHIWHGVSVENQRWKSRVIPHLVNTRSAVRFVSIEPLLEDIGNISDWFPREREISQTASAWIAGVHWVIIGGESGASARPFDPAWARSILRQCAAAGCPAFMKQLGSRPTGEPLVLRTDSFKHGHLAELPDDLRVREYPR